MRFETLCDFYRRPREWLLAGAALLRGLSGGLTKEEQALVRIAEGVAWLPRDDGGILTLVNRLDRQMLLERGRRSGGHTISVGAERGGPPAVHERWSLIWQSLYGCRTTGAGPEALAMGLQSCWRLGASDWNNLRMGHARRDLEDRVGRVEWTVLPIFLEEFRDGMSGRVCYERHDLPDLAADAWTPTVAELAGDIAAGDWSLYGILLDALEDGQLPAAVAGWLDGMMAAWLQVEREVRPGYGPCLPEAEPFTLAGLGRQLLPVPGNWLVDWILGLRPLSHR